MKYDLYRIPKESRNTVKKIDRAFSYFFKKMQENDKSLNADDYEILINSQLLLLAYKIVSLQLMGVGIGDTATDEAIVNEFEIKLKENKFQLKYKKCFFSDEKNDFYATKLYDLIH